MELKLDQWATTPPAGYPGTISPPPGKRSAGFANGEEPPAGYFNHAWDALSDTQNELANLITGAGLTRSESDLTQVLTAIQSLIGQAAGRAQLKTALTTVRKVADAGAQPLYALARAPLSSPGIKGQAIAVGVAASIQANTGPCSLFVTQTAASPFTGTFFDIAYDATLGLFIAVGNTGEIQTSTGDGAWLRRASGGSDLYKIATNGLGLCVAVGASGLIKYSTNGISWTTTASPFAGHSTAVAFGSGIFVLGTVKGDIASSPDGITWTVRRAYAGAQSTAFLDYHPALGFLYNYVNSPAQVFRSADGIAWTQIQTGGTVNDMFASQYGWVTVQRTPSSGVTGGTSAEVRYSPTAINQPPDFTVDYVTSDQLTWTRFIDGQLWALGGTKIYLGGVL